MARHDARDIAADAEEGRVAKRNQPPEAQSDVQPDGCETKDRHTGGERHVERVTKLDRGVRQREEQTKEKYRYPVFARKVHFDHPFAAGNKPCGRMASTTAITM